MNTLKGVYLLVIFIAQNVTLKIGALSNIFFKKGFYIYVGSAQKNLKKRISRHFNKNKRRFWHIDYLLQNECVEPVMVYYKKSQKSEECKTAEKLIEASKPIKYFGCSDCKCISHLFRLSLSKDATFNSIDEFLIKLNFHKYCLLKHTDNF
jgi:Uri superfamily endonuclease